MPRAALFRSSMVVLALLVPACDKAPPRQSSASVTVKLPPPRPYVPQPAFSFGSAPREG